MRKKESPSRPTVNPGAIEVKPTASAKTEEEVPFSFSSLTLTDTLPVVELDQERRS